MKLVLLAGGFGTRISEESHLKPKPMIEIGGYPILWHIMKLYSQHKIRDFVVCLGYKGYVVKEYFTNYFLHRADVTIDLSNNETTFHRAFAEPWRVTLIETGLETMTGGRLRRAAPYLDASESFCMTYGDGLSDVDISKLIAFHKRQGLAATLTAVRPPGRYGATEIDGDKVTAFVEKPAGDGGFVNGGFFVLEPSVFDLIKGDDMTWESEPLQTLARKGQLAAFKHDGFWQPMDTLRDKTQLESLWQSGKAPWKCWE